MQRKNYNIYPNAKIDFDSYIPDAVRELESDRIKDYKVTITMYKHQDPEKHYWASMMVQIKNKEGKVCAEFGRNYYSLDGIVVSQNGIDYFVTSSNYQCITICNLCTGEVKSYTDIDDIKHGCGFCPIYFDWDENTLYVEGCIWACPYETMKCSNIDLENPIPAFNTAEWLDDYDETQVEDEEDDE